MNKKVLIITYYWPPSGGPGVQRMLKFAKYLPQMGWDPIILTVKDGEYPAIDESLLKDIPKECRVYKTKSIEPNTIYRKFIGIKKNQRIPVATLAKKGGGWKSNLSNWIRLNLFIPDAKIGWKYYAIKKGKKIIRNEKPDLILSSSPPPTVHLIAKKLAHWSGIKWIADFRDPWTKIHYLHGRKINPLSRSYNKKLEKEVIKNCSKAICVSQNFVELLTETHRDKFQVITNGFDVEVASKERTVNDKFTIVYIGGLTWNRYYESFFSTLGNLAKEGLIDNERIKFLFAGSIEPDIQDKIENELAGLKHIEFKGYVAHNNAVELMNSADLLLLFLEKVEGYEGHIPGKLFEYISTLNPVLGIGNTSGESAELLRKTNVGQMVDPADSDGIKNEILRSFANWQKGEIREINPELIGGFSRKQLCKKLVEVFENIYLEQTIS